MLENDINDSYDYYNDNSSYYSDSNDGNSKSDTDNILNTPPKEVIEVKILKIFQKLHRNSLFELAWIINKTFFYNHLQKCAGRCLPVLQEDNYHFFSALLQPARHLQ